VDQRSRGRVEVAAGARAAADSGVIDGWSCAVERGQAGAVSSTWSVSLSSEPMTVSELIVLGLPRNFSAPFTTRTRSPVVASQRRLNGIVLAAR